MNKLIVTTILMTAMLASSVLAAGVTNPPAAATGSPIFSQSYHVTNDEDTGIVGYWALDSFTKTVTIWNTATAGTYVAYVGYSGTFCTYAGAKSPQVGTAEPNDGCGTMTGGYDETIKSLYGPSCTLTDQNMGGTAADVKKGTYALQTGNGAEQLNWVTTCFPYATDSSQDYWGWIYSLPSGQSTPWNNGDANDGGTTGDVITNSGSPIIPATVNVPSCTDSSQCASPTPICWKGSCQVASCGVLATPIDFGSVLPGHSKGDDMSVYSTISNNGDTPTSYLWINGNDWHGTYYSALNTMPVGSTSWAVLDGWNALGYSWADTGTNVGPSSPITTYFKLAVPLNTPNDNYAQSITLTGGC